jgi:hypothetical protein
MTFQEELKTVELTTYEKSYQEYLKNPKQFLGKMKGKDNMGNPTSFNIVKFEFQTDNEPYEAFREVSFDLNKENRKDYLLVEEQFIGSTIGIGRDKSILREHNRIRIDTPVGHICIAPHNDGLELTRIIVDEQGKGNGTILMELFFYLIVQAGLDLETLPIMLECVGSVGGGSNYTESNVSAQTKFFRKFGFRVNQKVSDYKNNYVQMSFKNEFVSEFKKEEEKKSLVEAE